MKKVFENTAIEIGEFWRGLNFPQRRFISTHYQFDNDDRRLEFEYYKEWLKVPVIALFLVAILYTQAISAT